MKDKEIRQTVKLYVASNFSSVGIEYLIKVQAVGIQQKFWNLVERAKENENIEKERI